MFRKKRITCKMPYLQLAPLASGNTVHFRSASRLRSFHWRSKGLRISTQGRPPRLTCGATGVSLSPLQIMAKQCITALSVEWIARYNLAQFVGCWLYVMALLRLRFLVWERASVLSIQLSRCGLINQTKQSRPGCFGIFHDLGGKRYPDFS